MFVGSEQAVREVQGNGKLGRPLPGDLPPGVRPQGYDHQAGMENLAASQHSDIL